MSADPYRDRDRGDDTPPAVPPAAPILTVVPSSSGACTADSTPARGDLAGLALTVAAAAGGALLGSLLRLAGVPLGVVAGGAVAVWVVIALVVVAAQDR